MPTPRPRFKADYRPGRAFTSELRVIQERIRASDPTNTTAMNEARKKKLREKLDRQIGGIGDPAVQATFDLLLELQGA